MQTSFVLLLAFPLAGLLYCSLRGVIQTAVRANPTRRNLDAGIVASAAIGATFVVAVLALVELAGLPPDRRFAGQQLWSWMTAGSLSLGFTMLIDPLSVLMAAVVSGVAFLIHVYAIGYMRGSSGFVRFFAYLNFFVLAMLILVLAGNFPMLMVGWGGVGLASYLLIAFRFDQPEAAAAALKAFVVNAIGDAGLLLATMIVFKQFGTLAFDGVFGAIGQGGTPAATLTTIALLLLVAAVAKSGQLPLHVWLPDAMVAPAPVSALIHAATMVTAGVYLVARMYPIFTQAPAALAAVVTIGAATALFAATIGLVQPNIKRVLAYSTISQLGYMFVAVGVGAFAAGIFHLMTHAFFKAALFLGAGAASHALDGEENLFRLGGLARRLPVAYGTFLAGALALAGIPPLAGFFSKEAILGSTFEGGHVVVGAILTVTVALTGIYTARAVFLAFHGPPNWQEYHAGPLHLPGPVMTIPLAGLGILAVVGGWIAVDGFLAPVFARYPGSAVHGEGNPVVTALALALAVIGFGASGWLYGHNRRLASQLTRQFRGVYELLLNRYYVDQIYDVVVVAPFASLARFAGQALELTVIDGVVRGVGKGIATLGLAFSRLQTGYVRAYVMAVATGGVALAVYLLVSGGIR